MNPHWREADISEGEQFYPSNRARAQRYIDCTVEACLESPPKCPPACPAWGEGRGPTGKNDVAIAGRARSSAATRRAQISFRSYRHRFLERPGASSVYRTVDWMLRCPR